MKKWLKITEPQRRAAEGSLVSVFIHACIHTHTHSHANTQIQITVLITVAVSVSRVMVVLLWGGGHVCVSLLSDAWYKRSEEGSAGGIWLCVCVCVWKGEGGGTEQRKHVYLYIGVTLLTYFGVYIDVCCCLHFEVNGLVCIQLLSLSQLRPCFLPNLLTSICLYL